MAKSGERRMLFDIRGRRKHVIRVVYAILALLMGASLFLVVGPLNIGELISTGGSGSASGVLDKQAENLERRLAKDRKDEALLLALARIRISAGNALVEVDPETGNQTVTPEARAEYERAGRAWSRYRKQVSGEPSASVAQLIARAYFQLAETSLDLAETESYVAQAARAQRIVAKQRPSVGSLSTLAIYEYFNGEFAAGDRVTKQAERSATSKSAKNAVKSQLAEYRKRGKEFEKQKKQAAKAKRGTGKQALENPFGGLSGTATP